MPQSLAGQVLGAVEGRANQLLEDLLIELRRLASGWLLRDREPAIGGAPKSPRLGRSSLAGWTVATIRGREDALAEVSVPS